MLTTESVAQPMSERRLRPRVPPASGAGVPPVVVIGAGPAGLTAAYELDRAAIHSVVLEKDELVGGLSRTVSHRGYRFDVGGHRFFTKVQAVERFWHDVLGHDFLRRPRLSRILYRGHYFAYPLKPLNVLLGLGPLESLRVALSYLAARMRPRQPEVSLEDWVINRFGEVLYRAFFKTYTEKVWGLACSDIGAEWAAQRIRGLSLTRAALAALVPGSSRGIKTLVDAFNYPRLGPGQMWERVRDGLAMQGRPVLMGMEVDAIHHSDGRVVAVDARRAHGGHRRFHVSHVISSMPLRELIEKLQPAPPPAVIVAAKALRYRDFLTVGLIIRGAKLFPDNWIYIHDPQVRVGRVQNFGNWSSDLVPEREHSSLGMEYFCFEGDDLWTTSDEELVALATREGEELGLVPAERVEDGIVIRMPKAYPVYDAEYATHLQVLREYLGRFSNLHPVGRNGLHKYNNQDHSMFTAMLAVRNILGESHDVWAVNADCDYHEEISDDLRATQPVTGSVSAPPTFARKPKGSQLGERTVVRGI
jgi:protoporphyrinogen oxidase